MRQRLRFLGTLCVALLSLSTLCIRRATAEHFDMQLKAVSGDKQVQSSMDSTPPIGGVNPRPVLNIAAGGSVKVGWRIRSSSPHGTMKNVTLHLFVVKQSKSGQKPVPDPAGQSGLFDSSFTTDLKFGAISTGSLKLRLTDQGSYLVRIQSEGTHEEAGHEHFTAVDVEVQ